MAEKKKLGFFTPGEIAEELDRVLEPLGGKRKWVGVTAAILLYVSVPEEVRTYILSQTASADVTSFSEILARAKSGELFRAAMSSKRLTDSYRLLGGEGGDDVPPPRKKGAK